MDELRHTDNLFKTSLCIQYEKGKCKNSEHCRYAHGAHELRQRTPSSDSDDTRTVQHNATAQQIINRRSVEVDSNAYDDSSDSYSDSSSISDSKNKKTDNIVVEGASGVRYNHLNPFFFYSINNFPMQFYVGVHQTMPFFNYIIPQQHNPTIEASLPNIKRIDVTNLNSKSPSGLESKHKYVSEYKRTDNQSLDTRKAVSRI